MNSAWRQVNLVCRVDGDGVAVEKQAIPTIPNELLGLFDVSELQKYFTEAELTGVSNGGAQ